MVSDIRLSHSSEFWGNLMGFGHLLTLFCILWWESGLVSSLVAHLIGTGTCMLLYVNCPLFEKLCPIGEKDFLAIMMMMMIITTSTTIHFFETEKLSIPFLQGCNFTVSSKVLTFYITCALESKHPCTDSYVVYTHMCTHTRARAHTHRDM